MTDVYTPVYLTHAQHDRIEALCMQNGLTPSAVVRAALNDYLMTHNGNVPEMDLAERQAVLDETFGSMPNFELPRPLS